VLQTEQIREWRKKRVTAEKREKTPKKKLSQETDLISAIRIPFKKKSNNQGTRLDLDNRPPIDREHY